VPSAIFLIAPLVNAQGSPFGDGLPPRWMELYFSRNRYTIQRDFNNSFYILNADVQPGVCWRLSEEGDRDVHPRSESVLPSILEQYVAHPFRNFISSGKYRLLHLAFFLGRELCAKGPRSPVSRSSDLQLRNKALTLRVLLDSVRGWSAPGRVCQSSMAQDPDQVAPQLPW